MDASNVDWHKLGIDWVVDCSGKYTSCERAQVHINSGAKHVLISAPCEDAPVTIIPGINDAQFTGQQIVSLGSCTTNALVPMLHVIQETIGIESCIFTTIHSYTNSQVLLDIDKKHVRRGRAAALNIIPTTTGASKVLFTVMPELEGKVYGSAVRVPAAVGSLLDLVFMPTRSTSADELNNAFKQASKSMSILEYTTEELKNVLA